MNSKLNRVLNMKKSVWVLLAGLSLMSADRVLGVDSEWVNRNRAESPVVSATTIHNYGELYLKTTSFPYLFDNNRNFYNHEGAYIEFSPALLLEYHDSSALFGVTNRVPIDVYQNDGVLNGMSGANLRVTAKEVIDSGTTMVSGRAAIDIRGENIDLWGAHYTAQGGAGSSSLGADGRHSGTFTRPSDMFPHGWGHGVNNWEVNSGDGPTVDIRRLAGGTSAQIATPTSRGVGDQLAVGGQKAYINTAWYDAADPKPFYQVVMVPADTLSWTPKEFQNPNLDPRHPENKDYKSYNQFRVAFGGAPYDNPMAPYSAPANSGARSVIVTQYSYNALDEQAGARRPHYEQIWMEDTSAIFWDDVANNTYVADSDGRGEIPDRMRFNRESAVVAPETFDFDAVAFGGGENAELPEVLSEDPFSNPPFGPLPADIVAQYNDDPVAMGTGIPTWTPRGHWSLIDLSLATGDNRYENLFSDQGPFDTAVAASCITGTSDDRVRAWLMNGYLGSHTPYGLEQPIDLGGNPYMVASMPDSPNDYFVNLDYSAYSATVGYNLHDKRTLVQDDGYPIVVDQYTGTYPGHVKIAGGDSVLDNLWVEALQAITLRITNLISAENMTLSANSINASFSKKKQFETDRLVLNEVMSPWMTRFDGEVAMYSAIYSVSEKVVLTSFSRDPEPEPGPEPEPEPEAGEGEGEGGDEGEGEEEEEEPETEDVSVMFHVVFVTSTADLIQKAPGVDVFSVDTEVPVEVTDSMSLREEYSFKTPDLTLGGAISFPSSVTAEKFVGVQYFTNLATLTTNLLSGSVTNTQPSNPMNPGYNGSLVNTSIDLTLGTDRPEPYKTIVNKGVFRFDGISLASDYFEMSGTTSDSSSYNSTLLNANYAWLNGANGAICRFRAGVGMEVNVNDLDLLGAAITTGDPALTGRSSLTGFGTLRLSVTNEIRDGAVALANKISGETYDASQISRTVIKSRGSIEVPIKPALGDLMNTGIEIARPSVTSGTTPSPSRISRNIWAGEDRGDTLEGWTNNLALGELVLSGSVVGNESLRFDFTPAGDNGGAIYVRNLYLGVTNDLMTVDFDYSRVIRLNNGMKLYYVNCYMLERNTPPPPQGLAPAQPAEWSYILQDKFPGKIAGVIQTQNHPNWNQDAQVEVTTADLNFNIGFSEDPVSSAAGSSIENPVELRWTGLAGHTYTVKVADSPDGEWSDFYSLRPTVDGTIVITLKEDNEMRFFRLLRE